MARLADELESEAFVDLPSLAYFSESIARDIAALRSEDAGIERACRAKNGDSALPALGAISQCYAAYEDVLEEEKLYEDADLLKWGTEALAGDPPKDVTGTVFAVIGDTELSSLESAFLLALKEEGQAFYRIGEQSVCSNTPETFAAARFSEALLPESCVVPEATPISKVKNVCRAVGAENEVRAAFQAILAAGASFDDIEIALAESGSYQGIVTDVAEEAGIDVTFSIGYPALQTRTGQALQGLYEWIQKDFDPALLIGMLRSGLIRIDRMLGRLDAENEWGGPSLASWLAGRRYEPGRAGYMRAFTIATEELESEIARLEEKGLDTDRERVQLRRIKVAREIITSLLDLVPEGKTSAEAMARMSQRYLERFGPIDAPDSAPEAKRSVEEAARGVLYQKLGHLRAMPFSYEAPAGRLAGMLREALEGQYVRSERPRPGAVHVVPLERAAFGGRSHLYVLGLGSEVFSTPETQGTLFNELQGGSEQEGESEEPDYEDQPDASENVQWLVRRALRRHEGAIHFFTSVYDVEEGEERFPAALFLEAESASEDRRAPLASYMPNTTGCAAGGGDILVDERTAWLAAHADGRFGRAGDANTPSARAAACERYDWLEDARAARTARASDAYTAHDGLLGSGAFSELDFTADGYDGPPLSAARLETFAKTPYLHFLRYVLGACPLDEPALDEAGWLDPLRRGSILHETFERFMKGRDGEEAVRLDEEPALFTALGDAMNRAKRRLAPPSDRVEAAALRRLQADARVFLRAEAENDAEPWSHERGFGFGPRRSREGDWGDANITFSDDLSVALRGRIDRVDERQKGGLAVWDYKTGSGKKYDESEPLAEGGHLQWALYAYVLEALTGKSVDASGYFFTSAKEMGRRLSASPAAHREEVGQIITRLGAMARAGCFPMNPRARYLAGWTWRGYEKLFPDLEERSRALKAKTENYPKDKPIPLFL